MDIPNLSQPIQEPIKAKIFSPSVLIIILVLAVTSGFFISRFFPSTKASLVIDDIQQNTSGAISADDIKNKEDIQAGKLYGNVGGTFKDSATGTIEAGNINGVGTHILNRDGGISQRAALTSATVDLDLFVGRKVEIKGETNASTKVGWLLDVGNIKVLE